MVAHRNSLLVWSHSLLAPSLKLLVSPGSGSHHFESFALLERAAEPLECLRVIL